MIKCTNVWFDYSPDEHAKDEWILRDMNLSIRPGEYVAIIGPNGSGKSTLARLLNGLLTPTQGKVQIGEYDTSITNIEQQWLIRKQVGVVFQNPDHQIVGSTVQDDIAFGLENLGIPIDDMKQRIQQVLDVVGLAGLGNKDPAHLSGGQKQRLAIAGVLAMQPEVIIFDEATAMLDPQGTKDVLAIIDKLHKQKKTIIHISHVMDEILLADRILLMAEGRIRLDISADQFYAHIDELKKWRLSLPLYLQLYRELKRVGWTFHNKISNKQELVNEIWKLLAKN